MSVKASVSISEKQDEFARKLVDEGRYASISAVVQRGLELLRAETDLKDAELGALRALVEKRMEGPFLSMEEASRQTEALIARKKEDRGV